MQSDQFWNSQDGLKNFEQSSTQDDSEKKKDLNSSNQNS